MKFKSKEEFIAEAERRGLKEGVAFRGAWQVEGNPIEFSKPWNWHEFYFDSGGDSVYSLCSRINDGYRVWIYDEGVWATPLKTPLEDRVKALELEISILKANQKMTSKDWEIKPTQSSRHFIMEGIIEKIYPKDKEKALEALVNLSKVKHNPLDKEKLYDDYSDEIFKDDIGNSFNWRESKQGYDYWYEIHDLLK